jgi:hypothetical protein
MIVRIEHEDSLATFEVRPLQKLLRLTWKGNASGEHYRSVLLMVLDLVTRQGLRLWLSDGRLLGAISENDEAWTKLEFTPQVMAAGLQRIAIVNSADDVNLAAVDRMVNATPPEAPYQVAFFQDPSIAQLWLMERTPEGTGA